MRVVAKISRCEIKQAGLLADMAVGCDAVALLDVSSIEELAQRSRTPELIV